MTTQTQPGDRAQVVVEGEVARLNESVAGQTSSPDIQRDTAVSLTALQRIGGSRRSRGYEPEALQLSQQIAENQGDLMSMLGAV